MFNFTNTHLLISLAKSLLYLLITSIILFLSSNSRVQRWGKNGERLFIQSSLPVPPGIRIRGPKSLGQLPFSQDGAAGPCRKSEARGPLVTTWMVLASSETPAAPRDLRGAFVAILAVRTRRLEGDVRTAYKSAREVWARFDCGPSVGRMNFGRESDALKTSFLQDFKIIEGKIWKKVKENSKLSAEQKNTKLNKIVEKNTEFWSSWRIIIRLIQSFLKICSIKNNWSYIYIL